MSTFAFSDAIREVQISFRIEQRGAGRASYGTARRPVRHLEGDAASNLDLPRRVVVGGYLAKGRTAQCGVG